MLLLPQRMITLFWDKSKEFSLKLNLTQDNANGEDEIMMKNMFESILTQIMLKCGDEIVKKKMFESVSTQMMMMCGEEIDFPMNNSVDGLLKKYTDVNVLQLVIDNYLAQNLLPKPGGYDTNLT